MNVDFTELQNEIVDDLTAELSGDATFNLDALQVKVKLAIKEVIARRDYNATNYDEEKILADLNRFYSTIVNVARYDYNQIGVEGEVSHSENGISRTYANRDSLFRNVHAFVGVI